MEARASHRVSVFKVEKRMIDLGISRLVPVFPSLFSQSAFLPDFPPLFMNPFRSMANSLVHTFGSRTIKASSKGQRQQGKKGIESTGHHTGIATRISPWHSDRRATASHKENKKGGWAETNKQKKTRTLLLTSLLLSTIRLNVELDLWQARHARASAAGGEASARLSWSS